MLLIIFLILLLLACSYFFFKDDNPYKLIMIFGKKGSGKSSHIAKESLKWIKKGYKVYTNIDCRGCFKYDPAHIGLTTFEPNSIVFCDEVGLIWNNRDFKKFQSYVREWFKYQRKYRIRFYMYSQSFDVDKQLRDLTDKMYLLTRIGRISIMRPIYKSVGITQDSDGNGKLADVYRFGSVFEWSLTYLPRYYGLFTSFDAPSLDTIQSVKLEYDEYSLMFTDTKRYFVFKFHAFLNFIRTVAFPSIINFLNKIFKF